MFTEIRTGYPVGIQFQSCRHHGTALKIAHGCRPMFCLLYHNRPRLSRPFFNFVVAGETFLEKSFHRTPFKRLLGKGLGYSCRIVLPLRGCSARVGALDDRRSRPAVALRVRLRASPSAQDDTMGRGWQRKLEFTLDFRRYFFSFKLIKKPSPVGEGGPRQWWMRSPREKLTYTRHLIRQPSATTFSHWRRLSFVSALYVNEYGNLCFKIGVKSAYVSS